MAQLENQCCLHTHARESLDSIAGDRRIAYLIENAQSFKNKTYRRLPKLLCSTHGIICYFCLLAPPPLQRLSLPTFAANINVYRLLSLLLLSSSLSLSAFITAHVECVRPQAAAAAAAEPPNRLLQQHQQQQHTSLPPTPVQFLMSAHTYTSAVYYYYLLYMYYVHTLYS